MAGFGSYDVAGAERLDEIARVRLALQLLEEHRPSLGDDVVALAAGPLRQRLATLEHAASGEQRKQVTVLFADVGGFTAMAEKLPPEEVRERINALWRQVDAIVEAHGGTVDKHIGDAVMALFGAARSREDDPIRAVLAGREMQEAVGALSAALVARGEAPLAMRVGVHTGTVVLGLVGQSGEYTAIGDTVNVASRLEGAAPVGGVLVSHATWAHLRDRFAVEADTIRVKGKSEPLRVYRVVGEAARAGRGGPGLGVLEGSLVGRQAELAALRDAWAASRDGLVVASVVGDGGQGKSRLVWELERQASPRMNVITVRASPETRHVPYGLLRQLCQHLFGISPSDAPAVARERLVARLRRMGGDAEGAEAVATLVGFAPERSDGPAPGPQAASEAEALRRRAFHGVAEVLGARALQRPVAVVIEDLQWADHGTLDLIASAVESLADRPVLFVLTARPALPAERRRDVAAEAPRHVIVRLPPLTEAECEALASDLLSKAGADPAMAPRVAAAADGNPYFVEELVRVLAETGAATVPSTLTSLLQARLDVLSPGEIAAIQRAAVVGRVFWSGAVEALGGPAAYSGVWELLAGRGIVVARSSSTFPGDTELVFRHALLHEVALGTVLVRDRRRWHARAAGWLQERVGDRADAFAVRIAEHWAGAEEPLLAGQWYARAGRLALRTFAGREAVRLLGEAVRVLPEEAAPWERLAALEGYAEALRWAARLAETRAALESMAALAERLGDRAARVRAGEAFVTACRESGRLQEGLDEAARVAELAREAGLDLLLARVLGARAWVEDTLGRFSEAQASSDESLAILRRHGALETSPWAWVTAGAVAKSAGRLDDAAEAYDRAVAAYRRTEDAQGLASALNGRASVALRREAFDEAVALYDETIAIAGRAHHRQLVLAARANRCLALTRAGRAAEAEASLKEVLRDAPPDWVGVPTLYLQLAEAQIGLGRLDEAVASALEARERGSRRGMREDVGVAWRLLGEIAEQRGPVAVDGAPRDAGACFAESLAHLDSGSERERTEAALRRLRSA